MTEQPSNPRGTPAQSALVRQLRLAVAILAFGATIYVAWSAIDAATAVLHPDTVSDSIVQSQTNCGVNGAGFFTPTPCRSDVDPRLSADENNANNGRAYWGQVFGAIEPSLKRELVVVVVAGVLWVLAPLAARRIA